VADADARPEFASDPRVNLWDDAATELEFLKAQTDVRRVAMRRFGLANLRSGEPVSLLEERFAPLYFFHRFAINGATKAIGGLEYSNAVVGDGQQTSRTVSAARQRQALSSLIAALQPAELAIPDTVLTLLAPRPFSYSGSVAAVIKAMAALASRAEMHEPASIEQAIEPLTSNASGRSISRWRKSWRAAVPGLAVSIRLPWGHAGACPLPSAARGIPRSIPAGVAAGGLKAGITGAFSYRALSLVRGASARSVRSRHSPPTVEVADCRS